MNNVQKPFLRTKSGIYMAPDMSYIACATGLGAKPTDGYSDWRYYSRYNRPMETHIDFGGVVGAIEPLAGIYQLLFHIDAKLYESYSPEYVKAAKEWLKYCPQKKTLRKINDDLWTTADGHRLVQVDKDIPHAGWELFDKDGNHIRDVQLPLMLDDMFYIKPVDITTENTHGIRFTPKHFHRGDVIEMTDHYHRVMGGSGAKSLTVDWVRGDVIITVETYDVPKGSHLYNVPHTLSMRNVDRIVSKGAGRVDPTLAKIFEGSYLGHRDHMQVVHDGMAKAFKAILGSGRRLRKSERAFEIPDDAMIYLGLMMTRFNHQQINVKQVAKRLQALGIYRTVKWRAAPEENRRGWYNHIFIVVDVDKARKAIKKNPQFFYPSKAKKKRGDLIRDLATRHDNEAHDERFSLRA